MNICKLNLVIILQRYSQSLPYSTVCVECIGMNLLRGLLISGGESLWLITCCKHHIALFSLYEFFPLGFSYKVFNEAISTKDYVISSIFLHRGFWWTILEYKMHFTLFFMWVFPFEVSHIKFLMRQCQHKGICYII